jgi:hypothetical protein
MADYDTKVAEREDIMLKVFELAESLLPQDGEQLPDEVEDQIAGISRAISHALGIKPERNQPEEDNDEVELEDEDDEATDE